MRIHILTNSVAPGDAVSAHCLLLRKHCAELGHQVRLVAAHAHPALSAEVDRPESLMEGVDEDDILLYQFFHYSPLACWADSYAGRRILMYHNITPPELAGGNEAVERECALGLAQLKAMAQAFDAAYGMSEFSRRDLKTAGYRQTGVFPLLIDVDRLNPPPMLSPRSPVNHGTRFVFLGRLAPNKRQDRLIRMLAAWRVWDPEASLTLIGDGTQHPDWHNRLISLCGSLGLKPGQDVTFTGKIGDDQARRVLLDSDVFVSASEHEGFGAPLIEAMALGLPIFAYDAGAVAGTLAGAGHLLRGTDEREWASEIRAALDDSASRWAIHASQQDRLEAFTAGAGREQVRALIEAVSTLGRRMNQGRQVSVVINTYNRGWWLDRCLASLETQTYSAFEVVVVNGPSSDDTADVLARWQDRIKIVQTNSRVLSVSRNEGIAAASGELVAFIDDDAVADRHWLERLVPAFLDPRAGGAGGLVYRMNGREIEFSCGTLDRQGFVEWNRAEAGTHFHWEGGRLNTVSGNNCIFRRAALEAIGGFDERIEYYHDEADVVWRIERAGYHTVHRPNAVVFHEAARSQNRAGRHQLNWYAIVKNTVYCALKNHSGPLLKPAAAAAILRRVSRERIAAIGNWESQGEISGQQARAYRRAAWKGMAVGFYRGWFGLEHGRRFDSRDEIAFKAFGAEPERLAVCLLSQSLPWKHPGGIATYTWELARGLAGLGCRVHLVSADAGEQVERREGVWIHRTPEPSLPSGFAMEPGMAVTSKNLAYSWAAHRAVVDIDAKCGLDVVESPNWDAEGVVTAIDGRLPVVMRAHSPLIEVAATQGWTLDQDLRAAISLERRMSRHVSMLTGSTQAILDLVCKDYETRPEHTRRIRLGLGTPRISADGDAAPDGRPMVLFAGRLEPRKGIDTLMAAIEALLDREPAARYVLAGDDGLGMGRAWLEKLRWRAPNWTSRIELAGQVSAERLTAFYGQCSLFVAPSIWESFGLVFLEAMSHGKPVVGTTAGGIGEVVEDGVTGILVRPGDADQLSEAILALLADPERRQSMGRAGLERWRRKFSREAMAASTEGAYRSLVQNWRSGERVIYQATAPEFQRAQEARIVWAAGARGLALRSEGQAWRTCVYGPYMTVPAGSWRAQFLLWAEGGLEEAGEIARVEAFCGPRGFCKAAQVLAQHLGPEGGTVVSVFFQLEEAMDNFEFRVHACSPVTILLREVRVTAWPAVRRSHGGNEAVRQDGVVEEVFAR